MWPSHFYDLFVVDMTVMYSNRQIVCCPKITKLRYIFQFFRWERKVSFELEIKLSSVGNQPQCFPFDSDGLYQRYRIFLFPRKRLRSLTHSISEKSVFFFPETGKKKIQLYFFFPRKRLHATHSIFLDELI